MAFLVSGPVWPRDRADVVELELPRGTIRILESEWRELAEFAVRSTVGLRPRDVPDFAEYTLPQSERFLFRRDDLISLAFLGDKVCEISERDLAQREPTVAELWRD